MNELTTYANEVLGSVRIVTIDGEPWFIALDVCRILDIANSRDAVSRLDSDEKGVATVYTLGGEQSVQIINEPGLYSLILTSRKEEAKLFKRWVTHEVLPAIRKDGFYSTLTPQRLIEVMKDKLSGDEHYLDDVQLAKVKSAVKADKRAAGTKLTEELWL